jgi:hypothetical protein
MAILVPALGLTNGQLVHAGTPSLEVLSVWGGPVNDVEVVGNTAYVAAGRRLVLVDVTGAVSPTDAELGSIDVGGCVRDLAVRNEFAYLGCTDPSNFCVIDVANPSNPSLVYSSATIPFGSRDVDQVELWGNRAYVRCNDDFAVYDISNPTVPVWLGEMSIFNSLDQMHIRDGLLYVTGQIWVDTKAKKPITEYKLQIHDLSGPDPLNPPLLGVQPFAIPTNINGDDFALDGSYAYVQVVHHSDTGADIHIAVIDVSNPAAPVVVSTSIEFFSDPPEGNYHLRGLAAADGHLYACIGGGNVQIYDIGTNPTNPTAVGMHTSPGRVRDLRFTGGDGWFLDDGEGLIQLDVSAPAMPTRIGHYHSPADLANLDKVGNLLYVVDAWNGITILDASNPQSTPVVVGIYQTDAPHNSWPFDNNWDVDVHGGRAYLTAGKGGFQVVDVSNPSSPTLIVAFPPQPNWFAHGLHVAGDIAHVGWGFDGTTSSWRYQTFDVASLTLLSPLLTVPGGVTADALAVTAEGIVFTGRHFMTPQTIDSSNPAAPFIISDNSGPIASRDVALDGNLRFLTKTEYDATGLYIHDVTAPANPMLVSFWGANECDAVALQNGRAYVTGRFAGTNQHCMVFDVTTPSAPVALASIDNVGTGGFTELHVDEPYVYVVSARGQNHLPNQGLLILEGHNLQTLPTPPTASKIYWAELSGTAVKRSDLGGTNVEVLVDALDGLQGAAGVVADRPTGRFYFVDGGRIMRANFDGSGVETLVTNMSNATRIAVDGMGGKMYWIRSQAPSGQLWRANLNGTNAELLLNINAPKDLALDVEAGKVYWTYAPNLACPNAKIQRASLDGSNVEDVVTGIMLPNGLALDLVNDTIYWSERCGVDVFRRANLDGSNIETLFQFASTILEMDVEPLIGKVYFTEVSGQPSILRCNLDGSGLEPVIGAGLSFPTQIDIDAVVIPCPADINSNGTVNIDDLLAVINAWGPCAGCPADINQNGVVNIDDLLAVINAWGQCG